MYYNRRLKWKQQEKPITTIGLTYQIDDIKVVLNRISKIRLRYKTQIYS